MSVSTRTKLLNAGTTLFAQKGYDATTIGEIEKVAGLSPRAGGFYKHFQSKEVFLLEIAKQRIESPESLRFEEVFPLHDTRAELIFIARAYNNQTQTRDGISNLIRSEASRIPAIKKLLDSTSDRLFQSLSNWIASKPKLSKKAKHEIINITLLIFGGWLVYLIRRDDVTKLKKHDSEELLQYWATFWAEKIDNGSI